MKVSPETSRIIEMMAASGRMPNITTVFSHSMDGTTHHFCIDILDYMIETNAPGIWAGLCPVDEEFANICLNNRGANEAFVKTLTRSDVDTRPIYMVEWDGQHLLVDGNHRFVAAHRFGLTEIKAFVFPKTLWSLCLLPGPHFTDEQMAALPRYL